MDPAGTSTGRRKPKSKKQASSKTKVNKKKLCEGGSCKLFLDELRKRFANNKKRECHDEDAPKKIVESIVNSLTNALPVSFTKTIPETVGPPMRMEELQKLAPEMTPVDKIEMPIVMPLQHTFTNEVITLNEPKEQTLSKQNREIKIPRMPVMTSDHIKISVKRPITHDAAVNTTVDHNVASEIAKHVSTLKRISLIAEEFHQKTAKNLIKIVGSVQEDLMKKLEEAQAEQKAKEEQIRQQQMLQSEMQVE